MVVVGAGPPNGPAAVEHVAAAPAEVAANRNSIHRHRSSQAAEPEAEADKQVIVLMQELPVRREQRGLPPEATRIRREAA